MANQFSDSGAQDIDYKQDQESNTKLNWLNVQMEPSKFQSEQRIHSVDSSDAESARTDQFFSHQQDEAYPGYNEQLASDRKYINDSVDHLARWMETAAGLAIGSWGIWAEKFRGSGKYLSKLEYKVNLTPTPSVEQAARLKQIKGEVEALTFAGRSTGAAILRKEQDELEKKILQRSKIISMAGLAAGLGCGQTIDGLLFRKDSPGDGTFCADVIAAPLMAWLVPKSLALKTGAILGAHVVGKLCDRWLQPDYIYNAKDENKSTLPTTEVNQFKSPFARLSEKPQSNEAEQLAWPQPDLNQSRNPNDSEDQFVFTREDLETRQANRERQQRDLEERM